MGATILLEKQRCTNFDVRLQEQWFRDINPNGRYVCFTPPPISLAMIQTLIDEQHSRFDRHLHRRQAHPAV